VEDGGVHGDRPIRKLDVLVNNAGIVNGSMIQRFRLTDWQKILNVNLTGTLLGIGASTDAMIANKSGSNINLSSIEGMRIIPG